MNLYGYAAGDPVNYSDPFGLEAEESTDAADADESSTAEDDEVASARAVCHADLRQAGASLALHLTGISAAKLLKSAGALAKNYRYAKMEGYGTFMRNAVGVGPTYAFEIFGSEAGGTVNVRDDNIGLAYDFLKMVPVAGFMLDAAEAVYSCREASMARARSRRE